LIALLLAGAVAAMPPLPPGFKPVPNQQLKGGQLLLKHTSRLKAAVPVRETQQPANRLTAPRFIYDQDGANTNFALPPETPQSLKPLPPMPPFDPPRNPRK